MLKSKILVALLKYPPLINRENYILSQFEILVNSEENL